MKTRVASPCLAFFAVVGLIVCLPAGPIAAQDKVVSQTELPSVTVLPRQVTLIHESGEGYAELPCVALTPQHAYISFDARTDGLTRLYLCRTDRASGGPKGSSRMETIAMTGDEQSTYGSALAPAGVDSIWLAWTALEDQRWMIKACLVTGMQPSPEMVVSGTDGLNSQVRVTSVGGTAWFVWALWERGRYRVMANSYDGSLGRPLTVYEGPNPVGRPDVCAVTPGHLVFVWDEYIDGRFVVRRRDRTGSDFGPVQDLSGESMANSWGARVCSGRSGVLATWHRVPQGETRCAPSATTAGTLYEDGLDLPDNPETWRVKCFTGPDEAPWAFWLNRTGHTSTSAYIRRVDPDGVSKLCRIRFRRKTRLFMQHVECACDEKLGLVWSTKGDVSFCEIEIPVLGGGELTPGSKGMGPSEPVNPSGEDEELGQSSGAEAEADEDEHPGDYSDLDSGPRAVRIRRNPDYAISYAGESLEVYFGDFHNHTSFSDGRTFPDMAMQFGRDARQLDFICITDHDGSLMPSEFAWNNAVADYLTEDGRYVCLHGYEVSKGWGKGGFGHWNMLFPGESTIFRYSAGLTPDSLYEVANQYGAVLIPHHVAKHFAPHNWDYHNAQAEPVVEMCSIHGIFETGVGQEDASDLDQGHFVSDGLARGYVMGFVASSDFHNPFQAIRTEAGLTGIYAPSLTSGSVFDAFKRRRTFGTTGAMIVVDFRCNGSLMGEILEAAGRLNFRGYADSPDTVRRLEIISDGKTVFKSAANDTVAGFNWTTEAPDSAAYYYMRVTTDRDMAWSSPIWIKPPN